MDRTFGCAPIYFTGAIIFLGGGGLLTYLGHPIVGSIIIAPGILLLVITLYVWILTCGMKHDEIPVVLQIDNEKENCVKSIKYRESALKNKSKKRRKKK